MSAFGDNIQVISLKHRLFASKGPALYTHSPEGGVLKEILYVESALGVSGVQSVNHSGANEPLMCVPHFSASLFRAVCFLKHQGPSGTTSHSLSPLICHWPGIFYETSLDLCL